MKNKFIKELGNLKILLSEKPKEGTNSKLRAKVSSYGFGQIDFRSRNIENLISRIKNLALDLTPLYKQDLSNKPLIIKIIEITKNSDDIIKNNIDELIKLAKDIKITEFQTAFKITVPNKIPSDIKADVVADLFELEKTFNSDCFRASTILCGRILETCLHRKYFEATGNDILEKNPGIGLGKLIAKLTEKEVQFDPGITQQIHLINQVRICSVHVKKEPFIPTKNQSYAMILYTLDVINKMF